MIPYRQIPRRGFTLMETLLAVALIGMLIGTGVKFVVAAIMLLIFFLS